MNDPHTIDWVDAVAARDQALARVAENAGTWNERVQAVIDRLPPGTTWAGEQIRRLAVDEVGEPHHHNAWGAAIMTAVRRGALRDTGTRAAMTGEKSHARKTPVYVVPRWTLLAAMGAGGE